MGEGAKIHTDNIIGGNQYNPSPIMERGSNANGYWIKMYEGTLVCYGKHNIKYRDKEALTGTVTLPHSYTNSNYAVIITPEYTDQFYTKGAYFYEKTQNYQFDLLWRAESGSGTSTKSGYNSDVGWLTIGRWKY